MGQGHESQPPELICKKPAVVFTSAGPLILKTLEEGDHQLKRLGGLPAAAYPAAAGNAQGQKSDHGAQPADQRDDVGDESNFAEAWR